MRRSARVCAAAEAVPERYALKICVDKQCKHAGALQARVACHRAITEQFPNRGLVLNPTMPKRVVLVLYSGFR